MARVTSQVLEVVVGDYLLDYRIVKINVVANLNSKQVLERSFVLHKHRNKEAFVVADFVVVVGKSIMRVEVVVSGALVHTGIITMLVATYDADIKNVLTTMVQERAIVNLGNVQEVREMRVVLIH